MNDCDHDHLTDRGYVLVARPKGWASRLGRLLPLMHRLVPGLTTRLCYEHADGECGCGCHTQPGMRECGFCDWRA